MKTTLRHRAGSCKRRLPRDDEREWLVIEARYYLDRLLAALARLDALDRRRAA